MQLITSALHRFQWRGGGKLANSHFFWNTVSYPDRRLSRRDAPCFGEYSGVEIGKRNIVQPIRVEHGRYIPPQHFSAAVLERQIECQTKRKKR